MNRTILALLLWCAAHAHSADPIDHAALRFMTDSYGRIKSEYIEAPDDMKLMRACVAGMAQSLDKHSLYMDGDRLAALGADRRNLAGVGLEVAGKDGLIKVLNTIEGAPAAQSDIRTGDVLVRIDSFPTLGVQTDDVIDRLRGPVGSKVRLAFVREGETRVREIELARQVLSPRTIESRLIEGRTAYLRIRSFDDSALGLLAEALEQSHRDSQGGLREVVLDLRGNAGGLLSVAVGVAATFLPAEALVAETRGRTQDSMMTLRARKSDFLRSAFAHDPLAAIPENVRLRLPVAVLVDGGTASGAEIVAGALQDHKRAILIGSTTFGIAAIQTIIPLGQRNGALKLTTTRYFTPNGRSFDGKGLDPDIAIPAAAAAGGGGDAALERALKELRGPSAT